jgi:hypothetical protein
MIIRQPVRCANCGHDHTLRVSIGLGKTQSHSFSCANCQQKLSIYFEKNYRDASLKIFKFENCGPSNSDAEQLSSFAKHHRDFLPIILHKRMLGALPDDASGGGGAHRKVRRRSARGNDHAHPETMALRRISPKKLMAQGRRRAARFDDAVPEDVNEFRRQLARRIAMFVNNWHGCPEPVCRRHRGCMAPCSARNALRSGPGAGRRCRPTSSRRRRRTSPRTAASTCEMGRAAMTEA